MRRFLLLALSCLLLTMGCALTIKQQTLHLKRDWLEVRERAVVAYSQGKLDEAVAKEFITVDSAFSHAYGQLVDKVLGGGDVTEDEIRHLQQLIDAWKDRIP